MDNKTHTLRILSRDFPDDSSRPTKTLARLCYDRKPDPTTRFGVVYQVSLIETHRDRAGDPPGRRAGRRAGHRAGRREVAGPAGHPPTATAAPLLRRTGRQGFPTPAPIRPTAGSPARPEAVSQGFGPGARGVAMPRIASCAPRLKAMGRPKAPVHKHGGSRLRSGRRTGMRANRCGRREASTTRPPQQRRCRCGGWMSRIARGFPPTRPLARRIAYPISMGQYQRPLVLSARIDGRGEIWVAASIRNVSNGGHATGARTASA